MSTVASVVPGTLQHSPSQVPIPSQQQQQQQPSTLLNAYQPPGSTILSTDMYHGHSMAQHQIQAQQLFRQKQLMVYQQQREAQLHIQQQQQLQQQQQQQQSAKEAPTSSPAKPLSKEQDDGDHEKENRHGSNGFESKQDKGSISQSTSTVVSPVNSNDILMAPASTLAQDPSPTPLFISTSRMSVLNKRSRYSTGLAVLRLLQFAEQLSPGDQALHRDFWSRFVADFFTPTSKTKWGLWNCETEERKSYYMSHHSMASFFHTLYESGVASIQLTLEQTMEYILPGGQMNVECPRANLIYRYTNGSLVSSTGHLWIRFSLTPDRVWKIKHFEFACQGNEEFVARSHLVLKKDGSKLKKSGKNALPERPVNAWGIPPKAYHILQMLDVAVQLDDMIFYSLITGSTAKESLHALAFNMEKKMDESSTAITTTPTAQHVSLDVLSTSPTEIDISSSPIAKGQTTTSKKKATNKRPGGMTRRKSLKNENKQIQLEQQTEDRQLKHEQDSEPATETTTGSADQQRVDRAGVEQDNSVGPASPVVKTQSASHTYPLQQQQQQQQAFFQQQRQRLLQQQAYQQQSMLQVQQVPGSSLGHGSSPVPTALSPSQQEQHQSPSDPLTQAMPYPNQPYPGSTSSSKQQQQQIDDMEDFIQFAEQSRKRRNSMAEIKTSPTSKKKSIPAE